MGNNEFAINGIIETSEDIKFVDVPHISIPIACYKELVRASVERDAIIRAYYKVESYNLKGFLEMLLAIPKVGEADA